MENEKKVLVGADKDEILSFVESLNGSKYRAGQIYSRIYLKSTGSFEEMTELPKDFRQAVAENAVLCDMKIKDKQISKDSTVKFLFELGDGNLTEAVLMRFDNRANLTACLSTQVGCAMNCAFCATGKLGFKRNLTYKEILQQIFLIQSSMGVKITNIVFMGQGEPLLNIENLLRAIKSIRENFQIGARRITVSTCGIIPGIKRLEEENFQSTVALSLHAPTSEIRQQIMPVEKKYGLKSVIGALRRLTETTGRRVTIEYTLIKDLNDSPLCAKQLCELLSGLKCNINLILYNENEYCSFKKPDKQTVMKFRYILEASGKKVTVRLERGADIDAACGQLSSKKDKKLN